MTNTPFQTSVQDTHHFGRRTAQGCGPPQEFATQVFQLFCFGWGGKVGDAGSAGFSRRQQALALQFAVSLLDRLRANGQGDGDGPDRWQFFARP
jgi:hypothetical protein